MTTTIEQITAIIDEATADERAKVLDLERRLSNAYADLVSKKEALTNVTRDLRDLTVENNQQRAEVAHLGKLNAEQDEQIRALRDMLARATPATDDAALIVALRKDKADLNEKIGELRVERDIACAQLAKIQGTPVDEATANAYAVGALLKKIEEHEATIESMGRMKQGDDLHKTIGALTKDRDNLLAEVAKRDSTIAALRAQNEELRSRAGTQRPRTRSYVDGIAHLDPCIGDWIRVKSGPRADQMGRIEKRSPLTVAVLLNNGERWTFKHGEIEVLVQEPTEKETELAAKLDNVEQEWRLTREMASKQIERLTREKATAYRKLAEVSRKCLGLMKESAHLRTLNAKIVDDCNKEIDELNEKCAALVVENKRLDEYASGNWVDVPPPSDAGCLYPECGPICRRDCPHAPVVETPAVEERGPWVVYDPEREYMLPYRCVHKWVKPEELEDAVLFRDANSAQNCVHDLGIKRYRVITLAEARAIEAQKTNG